VTKRNASRARFVSHVAGTAAAAALFRPARAYAQSGATSAPLRIAVALSDGVTSVLYAKQAGMFEKAGLNVTIDTHSNGAAVAAAVLSGNYDIGNSSITSILLAHERGIPFSFVAPAGITDSRVPHGGALVLKDSAFTMGKDAENTTMGTVSLSGSGHDAMCAWVDQHGGDPRTIKFVEVPFSLAAPSLAAHRVVASETSTPSLTLALDTGNFRLVPVYNAIAPTILLSAWFSTTEFTGKHPDAVRTFARVVAAAGAYTNAHHAEAAPVMSTMSGIPVATILREPWTVQGTLLDPGLIQPIIAAAAKYGTLKKAFPAQDLIDPSLSA
jgi:NitT/TauT family transport system substrate-binding protein